MGVIYRESGLLVLTDIKLLSLALYGIDSSPHVPIKSCQ